MHPVANPLNATALDAAFCDAGTKEALDKILQN
jgi:hypothetical protein